MIVAILISTLLLTNTKMTGLFALLSGFMLNPYFDTGVTVSPKEKTVIIALINDSKVLDTCSITWPVGMKKGTIVLGLTCAVDNTVVRKRLGVDYKNKLRMKKTFYPESWK